jgi:hypothetical protein
VIADHGHRRGDVIVVDASQASLAHEYGVSTGTVAYYLRTLGPAILARRPLTIDPGHLHGNPARPSPAAPDSPTDQRPKPTAVAPGDPTELATVAAHLLAAVTRLLETIDRAAPERAEPRTAGLDRSRIREPVRGSFAVPRIRSRFREQCSETVSTEVQEEPHSLTDSQTRERTRETREPSRTDEPAPDIDWIDSALQPLLELCNRHHLVGVTNRQRLHQALSRHRADQVEHAIGLLCTQLRAGAPIRSPIGLLVRLAEQHHTAYFPAHARGADRPSSRAEDCDRADDESSLPESLPVEMLDELDRHVEASLRALPTVDPRPARPEARRAATAYASRPTEPSGRTRPQLALSTSSHPWVVIGLLISVILKTLQTRTPNRAQKSSTSGMSGAISTFLRGVDASFSLAGCRYRNCAITPMSTVVVHLYCLMSAPVAVSLELLTEDYRRPEERGKVARILSGHMKEGERCVDDVLVREVLVRGKNRQLWRAAGPR